MKSQQFAKGGKGSPNKMLGQQSAGKAAPGHSGKVQSAAPGAKSAKGGGKTSGHSLAKPVAAGHTAPPRKG